MTAKIDDWCMVTRNVTSSQTRDVVIGRIVRILDIHQCDCGCGQMVYLGERREPLELVNGGTISFAEAYVEEELLVIDLGGK